MFLRASEGEDAAECYKLGEDWLNAAKAFDVAGHREPALDMCICGSHLTVGCTIRQTISEQEHQTLWYITPPKSHASAQTYVALTSIIREI